MLQCTNCGETVNRAELMGCHASIDDTCHNCLKDRRMNLSPILSFQGTFIHEIRNPLYLRMESEAYAKRG